MQKQFQKLRDPQLQVTRERDKRESPVTARSLALVKGVWMVGLMA